MNIFEYIVMRRMIFSSENPPKINKIKKHDVPDLYRSLHRICFYLEFCLQFRQHGNCVDHKKVVVPERLKQYDGAQPGKHKTDSATLGD